LLHSAANPLHCDHTKCTHEHMMTTAKAGGSGGPPRASAIKKFAAKPLTHR
jgi:hypothetical protein